jgi:hypothetical protein
LTRDHRPGEHAGQATVHGLGVRLWIAPDVLTAIASILAALSPLALVAALLVLGEGRDRRRGAAIAR